MAITRVTNQSMAAYSTFYFFNGGTCDCAIIKVSQTSGGAAASILYGGAAMVNLASITDAANSTFQIWGILNPPQSSVAVSITPATGGGGTIVSSQESYIGADTTATFPNVAGAATHSFGSGSLTNIQVDVNTTVNDCILVGIGGYRGPNLTEMQAGSNTAIVSAFPASFTGGTDISFESTPLDVGVAGTYHLEGTTGGGSSGIVISLLVAAIAPFVAPAATPGNFFLVL